MIGIKSPIASESGIPREELQLSDAWAPRLGWTVFDPSEPERGTPAQAGRLAELHQRQPVYLRQVHLTSCLVLKSGDPIPSEPVEADGILTDRKDVLVGVSAADCLPLFLISRRVCGVLHAGWRGVLGGILPLAVHTLRHEFGVQPDELQLFTGPAIRSCCFEVSTAVWSCFPPESRLKTDSTWRLDMLQVIERQWKECGAGTPAVHLGRCTVCGTPKLHSFRRDRGRGRNFAFLYFEGNGPERRS